MIAYPNKIYNPFLQIDLHDGLYLVGPIPALGKELHISLGLLWQARWGGTSLENDHRVLADGLEVLSRGHEVAKWIIPHLNVWWPYPGPDLFIPLHILASSNKCMLAALSVRLKDDKPMAVTYVICPQVGLNLACNDPCMFPTCFTVNWGTVEVGISWRDVVVGLLLTAVDVALDYLARRVCNRLIRMIPKGLTKAIFKPLLRLANNPVKKFSLLVVRATNGRFASGAVEIGETLYESFLSDILPEILPNNVVEQVESRSNQVRAEAEQLSVRLVDWIDGKSETLPSD